MDLYRYIYCVRFFNMEFETRAKIWGISAIPTISQFSFLPLRSCLRNGLKCDPFRKQKPHTGSWIRNVLFFGFAIGLWSIRVCGRRKQPLCRQPRFHTHLKIILSCSARRKSTPIQLKSFSAEQVKTHLHRQSDSPDEKLVKFTGKPLHSHVCPDFL